MQIAGISSSSSSNVAIASARQPLFHSPDRLIVGNAPLVGVIDLPGSIRRPPIRLYFPADTATTTTSTSASASSPSSAASSATAAAAAVRKLKPAKYFVNNRVAYFLQGFAHLALARHTTKVYRYILRPLVWLLSLVFPARYLKIPGTVLVRNNKRDANVVKYLSPELLELKLKQKKVDSGESNSGEDDDDNAPSMQAQQQQQQQQQQQTKKQRLIVFSHGLTGTGEENTIYCTSLAKKGYVVASLHHRDGSSCRVPMPDGTCRYYQHMPVGDDYDPYHRLEQVTERAEEFLYTCDWLVGNDENDKDMSDEDDNDNDTNNGISESHVDDEWEHHPIVHQIRQHLDKRNVIAAGFSYGAATASLAATLAPAKFQCTILLDGWFHIDYSSRGMEYDFPPESFGATWPRKKKKELVDVDSSSNAGEEDDNDANNGLEDGGGVGNCKRRKGLDVPSLFINSGQFHGYEKLYGATKRLADQINGNVSSDDDDRKDDNTTTSATRQHEQRAEMHVIPGTMHQNFCDIIFWVPRRWGKKMFELGDADAYEAYEHILNWTVQFLDRL